MLSIPKLKQFIVAFIKMSKVQWKEKILSEWFQHSCANKSLHSILYVFLFVNYCTVSTLLGVNMHLKLINFFFTILAIILNCLSRATHGDLTGYS